MPVIDMLVAMLRVPEGTYMENGYLAATDVVFAGNWSGVVFTHIVSGVGSGTELCVH